jgi:hypothetical protein
VPAIHRLVYRIAFVICTFFPRSVRLLRGQLLDLLVSGRIVITKAACGAAFASLPSYVLASWFSSAFDYFQSITPNVPARLL